MEVTCERCSTAYDFDDALVSERGTTVKCTTCSHQFKVRRPALAAGPDIWVVRTVDGREIEFGALRDLQAAIQEVRVTRDDVLVRGNSRPRRLGSIAELEPFFSRVGVAAPPTQRRARTLAGGHAAVQPSQETSVVFSLPNVVRTSFDQDAAPPSYRRGSMPPPAPGRGTLPPPMPVGMGGRQEGSPPPYRRGSMPPPPPVAVGGRKPPSARPSSTGGRFGETTGGDFNDEHSSSSIGIERVSALPPPPPPPRKSAPPPPPMFPTAEPPPPPFELAATQPMNPGGFAEQTKISKAPAPPPEKPLPPRTSDRPPPNEPAIRTSDRPPPNDVPNRVSERPPTKDTPLVMPQAPAIIAQDKPAVDKPSEPPAREASSPKAPVVSTTPKPADTAASINERKSKAPPSGRVSVPTSSARSDEPDSERHFSTPIPSRRAGAARWIVGLVLAGCAALAAVTLGPQLLNKPPPIVQKSDPRIDTHLTEGDRALNDGDLDAASDAYAKASALAEKDGRIDLRMARVAIMRADVPWLKVRLLLESDAEHATTRRELELAAERATAAVDRAQQTVPNDPDVKRCRIDALRLAGKVTEARGLVATLPKQGNVTNDDVLFAALDLAEQSPTWTTVIERLSLAARAEQNLGRARAMLIYALVRSGDLAKAKTELDALLALPRPHPLIGSFRSFIARVEKESAPAAPTAVADAGAPLNDEDGLKQAIEAMNKGELEQAATLLQQLETRLPNDSKVLTAAGQLAQKKRDRANAVLYFQKAIAADKNNLDAMTGLADLKWDNGEKQGASILYRQIIERGGGSNDNPLVLRAKQRFASYMENLE